MYLRMKEARSATILAAATRVPVPRAFLWSHGSALTYASLLSGRCPCTFTPDD